MIKGGFFLLKDKILIGAVIGLLADALKLITNYILFTFGFTKVVFWQITAIRFIPKEDLYHKLTYLVGAVADMAVSSLLGVVFVYVIYLFGSKNLWIKGMGFGFLMGLMTLMNAFGPGLFGVLADFTNLRTAILWYTLPALLGWFLLLIMARSMKKPILNN